MARYSCWLVLLCVCLSVAAREGGAGGGEDEEVTMEGKEENLWDDKDKVTYPYEVTEEVVGERQPRSDVKGTDQQQQVNKMLCSLKFPKNVENSNRAQPMENLKDSACTLLRNFPQIQWCQGVSNVYALPVGQGDCTVITCPDVNTKDIVVFDCGNKGGNKMEKDAVRHFLQLPLEGRITVIISHSDKDHLSYIKDVFQNQNDVHIVVANTDPIQNSNWKVYRVNNGESCIGDCNLPPAPFCGDSSQLKFEILASNAGGSNNQQSIVMKVTYGSGLSLLLSGDIEGKAMETIAVNDNVRNKLPSYYYKIAHHGAASEGLKGSPSSYISQWLKAIYPTNKGELFVSHAFKNNFNHPRCESFTTTDGTDYARVCAANINDPKHTFRCNKKNPSPQKGFTETTIRNQCLFSTSPEADKLCIIHIELTNTVQLKNNPPACDCSINCYCITQ